MIQFTDPNAALNAAYQAKQQAIYNIATLGDEINLAQAYSALWRAASNANLLQPHEVSEEQFTPHRVQELVARLGWG